MTTAHAPEPFQPAPTNLSMEQEFSVVRLMAVAENASKEQLLGVYKLMLIGYLTQKNYYEAIVKQQWLGNIDVASIGNTEEELRG